MITPPDETYSTAEAAALLSTSERQCARYLKAGLIQAKRPNGRWRITALAIWKYLGIEEEMTRVWLEYCGRALQSAATADAAETPADTAHAPEALDTVDQANSAT